MSPKKCVENLSTLCLKTATNVTLDAIKTWGEECVKELKQYFHQMPRTLCDEILLSVLGLTPLSSFTKWLCFCIFQFKCHSFDSRMLSPKFHQKFVENLRDVVYLNLTDAQITKKTIRRLIRRCPSIKSLIIPNFATDEILREVQNLKNLKQLDISGNAVLSPEGLAYLSNNSLEILIIGTPLTYSIAHYLGYNTLTDIMERLPNLTEIRTYEYTGRAFLEFKKPYVSKLKSICDCFTNREQMEAIIAICPCLEELYLEDPENIVFQMLPEFEHLKKLRVSKYCQKKVALNIRSLHLSSLEVKQIPINIGCLCLTLKHISARSCLIFNSLSETYLKNLQTIELIDCVVKKEMVMPLLEHCNMLERLGISSDIGLTDLDIRTLCNKNCLKNLKELWLSLAKSLSSDSVVLLMNHCDKLKLLGTLNGWNIEKREVNYLRCIIYFTNTDLNLLYFSCF